MKKTIFVIGAILIVLVAFLLIRPANEQTVSMNNETCPVSGKPVNEGHTYVHEGKEYNLCSDECKKPLSENPEKYLSE